MKTGIDIVKISRFEEMKSFDSFLEKYYSLAERDFIESRSDKYTTAAGNFAAKEAFSKALGTGVRGFLLNEVSVLRDSLGKPYFELSENVKHILKLHGVSSVDVSISHEKEYAASNVVFRIDDKFSAFSRLINAEETGEGNINSALIKPLLPMRDAKSHKGDYGKVLAVCGSYEYMGAGVMSTKTALKCGSGLVTLACQKSLNGAYRAAVLEVMTLPLEDKDGEIDTKETKKIIAFAKKCDALLIGCGLKNTFAVKEIVADIITSDIKCPIIIDADGLNVIAGNCDIFKKAKMPIVLTPHLMEFSRLSGYDLDYVNQNRQSLAIDFAKKYNVTLVLKSEATIVVTPDGEVHKNIHGNAGMAKGGSGDVLAGAITSFIGQNIAQNKVNAVTDGTLAGVYVHSLAGDMAKTLIGEDGMCPTDIMENIPYAIKYLKGDI